VCPEREKKLFYFLTQMNNDGDQSRQDSAVMMRWDQLVTAAQITDSTVFSTWE